MQFRTASVRLALGAIGVGGAATLIILWWTMRPSPAAKEYRRGKDLAAIGMLNSAREAYTDAIRRDANYAPPYRALAEMAVSAGNNSASIGYWHAYLARAPQAKHAWARLAQAEMTGGLDVPALHDAQQELRINPGSASAHLILGILDAKRSQAKSALLHLAIAVRAYPDNLQAKLLYGKALALTGQYDLAEVELNQILQKTTAHPEPYFWLGYIYARLPAASINRHEAEKYLLHALVLNPDYPQANFELGHLRCLQRRYSQAIPLLKKAIAGKKHYIAALYVLAQAQSALGEKTQALRTQEIFLKQSDLKARQDALLKQYANNPNSVPLELELGQVEIQRDEPFAALIFLRPAHHSAPQDTNIQKSLQQAESMQAHEQEQPALPQNSMP